MKLTPGEIEELRVRYEKALGESISYDKAADMGDQLVELYRVTLNLPPDPPPSIPGRYPS